MEVKERIAYMRGLMEGSEILEKDPATRAVWENLLSVCEDLADTVEELETSQDEIEEYVEGMDTDLCDLEEDFYGADAFDDDESEGAQAEDDGEELEDDFVRAECPRCGEEVFFEETFLYDDNVEISCPECGEILYQGETDDRLEAAENGERSGRYPIENAEGSEPRISP